jgi:hypothetical protein
MTNTEITALIGYVNQRWPHAALDADAFPVWREDLADMPTEEVGAAVRAWARAGERFPPTSGWVRSEVERRAQTGPPSFDEAQQWVARHIGLIPYGDDSREALALALERMAGAGAHEAVLRWVQSVGLYAVRMTPDPSLYPLDIGQQADRRDRSRDYAGRVLAEWRADPRPGLAVARAREALGRGGELHRLPRAVRALPGGEAA